MGRIRDDSATGTRAFCWWAVALALAAGIHYLAVSTVGTDDALIYVRATRNLLEGVGPVINPGDGHSPVTSVLWVAVLALSSVVSGETDLLLLARVLGAILTAGSALLLALSFRRYLGTLALAVPVAVASVPMFDQLAGLETSLAVFGVSLAHWLSFGRRHLVAAAAALGFAFFCRGDAVLLGAGIAVGEGWQWYVQRDRGRARRMVLAAAVFMAVVGSGLLLHHLTTGHLLPTTLHTKMLQGDGGWSLYSRHAVGYAWRAAGDSWGFVFPAALGVWATRMAGAGLLLAAGIHWAAYAVLGVPNYPWYSWLLMMSIRVLVVAGSAVALAAAAAVFAGAWWDVGGGADSGSAVRRPGVVSILVTFGLAALFVNITPPRRLDALPALSASPHHGVYLEVARSLCGGVPGTTAAGRVGPILVEEIGMIGLVCPDLEIRDVNGLASPGVNAETMNNWGHWVEVYRPTHLCYRGEQGVAVVFDRSDGVVSTYPLVERFEDRGYVVTVYALDQSLDRRRSPRSWEALLVDGFDDGDLVEWSAVVRPATDGAP